MLKRWIARNNEGKERLNSLYKKTSKLKKEQNNGTEVPCFDPLDTKHKN